MDAFLTPDSGQGWGSYCNHSAHDSCPGQDTVKVTKVNGHDTEAGVDQGRVSMEDRMGFAEADTAAELGRRHQSEAATDARRALLNARELWHPVVLQLHRFMVAVSHVSVNHDGRGGSALDPLVWDQGSRLKSLKCKLKNLRTEFL